MEATPAQRAATAVAWAQQQHTCCFSFVPASVLLHLPRTGGLPEYKELSRRGELHTITISVLDAVGHTRRADLLAVSHRWETPEHPDPHGVQLSALQVHLQQNPQIRLVWCDFCCLPQGRRTDAESALFSKALEHVNLLYLSLDVLLMVDNSFSSRFWTMFESWLAMQSCSSSGLSTAVGDEVRWTIACLYLARPEIHGRFLEDLWRDATVARAHDVLSSNDITVTNLRDKQSQLPKLMRLESQVKDALALTRGVTTTALRKAEEERAMEWGEQRSAHAALPSTAWAGHCAIEAIANWVGLLAAKCTKCVP